MPQLDLLNPSCRLSLGLGLCVALLSCSPVGSSGNNGQPSPCSIGEDPTLTSGPSTGNVGDITGFTPLSTCGVITENVYLTANVITYSGDCFTIGADNITIDGQGFTVTPGTGKDAVYNSGFSGVTIRNLQSPAGISLYGGNTKNCTVENSKVAFIYILSGDGHTIQNNELGSFFIDSSISDPATNITFSGNTLNSSSDDPITIKGSTFHPCPPTHHLIEKNIITSTAPALPSAPHVIHFYCSKANTIRGNLFKATDGAAPLLMSDEANDNLFEENTFWASHYYAAFFASGDADKTAPTNNTFRNNIFQADNSDIFFEQAIGGTNTFENNVFWGAGSVSLIAGYGNTYDHNTFFSTNTSQVVIWDLISTPVDKFENNIVSGTGGDSFGFTTYDVSKFNSDYNLFFNTTGAASFENKGNLSGWQTTSKTDGLAQDVHSIEGDPNFVNSASGNFLLISGSPATGKDNLNGDIGAFPVSCTP